MNNHKAILSTRCCIRVCVFKINSVTFNIGNRRTERSTRVPRRQILLKCLLYYIQCLFSALSPSYIAVFATIVQGKNAPKSAYVNKHKIIDFFYKKIFIQNNDRRK